MTETDRAHVRVAVVGVGAAGLATSFALSDQLGDTFDLTLFDPSFQREHRAARGYPYQADPAEPMLNAPARMMSVRPGNDAHFTRWLERTRGATVEHDTYVTRPTYGLYLRDSLTELQQLWNDRVGLLHCVPEQVVDLTEASSGQYTLRRPGRTSSTSTLSSSAWAGTPGAPLAHATTSAPTRLLRRSTEFLPASTLASSGRD